MESSATECVAVVHQRITQPNSSGLMNIESSFKLTRSGDTAYRCIEGIDEDNYQVGVIGAVEVPIDLPENGSWVCGGTCIIIIVLILVVIFLILVIAPLVVICLVCRQVQLGKRKYSFNINIGRDHSHSSNDHSVNNVEDSGLATDTAEQDNGLEPGNDQYQEIDFKGTIVIDMEQTMAVDEAVAQVGRNSASNSSHDEGAPTDQASEMETTCNKEVIPLSTTNMRVKEERKELADDVTPLNEPDKNVASDDSSILQESTNPIEEVPPDQLNMAEDLGNQAEIKDTMSESTPAAKADDVHVHTNSEGNDPIGFETDALDADAACGDKLVPVASSTPRIRREPYARIMEVNSSSSESIFIYHNGVKCTRNSLESGQRKDYITYEDEVDDSGAVEATEQSAIKPDHNSKDEKDSDYVSMPSSGHIISCTSDDQYSETVEYDYQYEADKKKTLPSQRYDFVIGDADKSSSTPGDSGINNVGMGSSTFMIFSEDQPCQTSFEDNKPFNKSCDFDEDGGNLTNTMPGPGVLTKN